MSAGWTPGPWYVRDLSAQAMHKLGWTGPSIDIILITNKTGPEIIRDEGEDAVIARIEFKHRPENLGEGNLADANLIAAAPCMFEKLTEWLFLLDSGQITGRGLHAFAEKTRDVLAQARAAQADKQ